MAGNYTIPVDVELRTKQQNVKNLRSAIENEFRDIDFNSSIGKQLNKLFNQFDTKISDMDSILGKGILDMGDLNKLNGIFNRMNLIVGQMRSSTHKAPLVDLGIDAQSIPELVEARNLVKQITGEMAKQKAVSTKDRLKQTGQQDLLDDLNKIQKTKAHENKPLGINAKIIQDELNEAEHLVKQHYEKRDQLDKQFQEKSAKAKQSQKILDDAEADYVKNAQKASLKQIMALETAAGKKGKKSTLESQFGGGNKLSQKSAQKFLDEFMVEAGMAFEGTQISGTLTQKLWEGMFTENEITQMQQAGGDMGEALYAGLEQKLLDPTSRECFRQIVHDFSKNVTGSAEGYVNTADNIKKNLPNLMNQAKADAVEVQAIEQSQIDNANAIATLEPQIASFKVVVDRLATAASTLETVIQNKYQKELNEANKAAEWAKINAVDQSKPILAGAQVGNQPIPQYQQQGIQAQEAEKFKTDLQQSIKQWMGAREVINYIKQGIRQAWTDIQGLDKAMTNIAVVTDFSVSDLWGKINEYMSIAQQYGVTTQGVYEVSQLYFQQGLGEADTMAATVETLKMARIAGMDYAEAADGMTVAIRGFNMEMQDAAHVTDVYSKVAAITASDTQELVTAMSKTASSAAAVGSSFENTTAMLAVMIEATRESPQNLGSALKSIISRYGEMTKGLTEDNEGEEIDYNRVDTALKTVGISLKDAQGQFRDFDTVIEELSAKWATLDSVTQRYIATIFAGNRQQSRFLALVSNYDRYMEVSEAAADSEDAGLLQYSKTLDSLETKLNNIKTSFQQFYMSIANGDTFKGALDFINNLIKGFNKLSKFTTVLNLGSIIISIKTIGNLLVNGFTSGMSQIQTNWRIMMQQLVEIARKGGIDAGEAFTKGTQFKTGQKAGLNALLIGGGALSMWGSSLAQKNQTAGALISGAGNAMTYGVQAGLLAASIPGLQAVAPAIGVAVGAITGLVSAISSIPSAVEKAQQKSEQAQQEAEEANIKRAEAKQRISDLESGIDQLTDLSSKRFDSLEAEKEWLDANNAFYEKFPELAATFEDGTNAIVDLESAELLLAQARAEGAKAAREAAKKAYEQAKADREKAETNKKAFGSETVSETNAAQYVLPFNEEALYYQIREYRKQLVKEGIYDEGLTYQRQRGRGGYNYIGFGSKAYQSLFTSGIDLTDNSMLKWLFGHEKMTEDAILQSVINNLKAGTLKFAKDADENTFVSKLTGGKYATATKLIAAENLLTQKSIYASKAEEQADLNRTSVEVSALLDENFSQADFLELENASSLIQKSIKQKHKESGKTFDEFESQIPVLINEAVEAQQLLWESLYGTGQIDEFNSLIQSMSTGKITDQIFNDQIVQLFGRELSNLPEELKNAINLYYNDFTTNLKARQKAVKTSLTTNREATWEEGKVDVLLANVAETYYDQLIDFANIIETKIGEGTLTKEVGENQINALIDLLNQTANLPIEQIGQAQQILLESDLFTTLGQQEAIQKLQEAGIDVSKINPTVISTYAENLITQYGTLQDKLISNLKSTTEALENASDGTTLEEASSIAKKVGKDVTELFDFQDGKYFAKNAETLNQIYAAYSDSQKEALNDSLSYQKDLLTRGSSDDAKIRTSMTEHERNEYSQLIEQYRDSALAWVKSLDSESLAAEGLSDKSTDIDKIKAYLTDYSEDVSKAIDNETQWQLEQATKALAINNRTHELESTGIGKDKREAFSLLSSKGITGYSAEEIAQLEQYLGVGKGGLGAIETGEGTGEYRIDQSKLAELPQWVQTAIWNIINDSTQSSLDEIASLGAEASKIGGADKGVYASAFEKYAKRFGAEWTENYIPSLIEGAIAESYSDAAKYDSFTNQLKNLIKQENPEATDEEIEEKTKELINGYKDGLKEAEEEIIDLKLDALEKGFISASDKETLKEVDINFAQSFDEAIAKTGIERAQAIYDLIEETLSQKVNSGSMTELEKIEELGKTSSKQFQALYQKELKNAYFEEAKTSIIEGDRILSFDELGKLQVASGKSLEYFYSKYIKGLTETGEAILNIPTMFADGIITDKQYAQFQRNFAEETFGSAEDLITRMASKDDVYADEIESFFEAIGISLKDVTLDDGTVISGAEGILRGGVDNLLASIEVALLTAVVPQSDIDSRLAEIQAQLVDLLLESISSGISSLSAGLEGTLSATDYQGLVTKYGLIGSSTLTSKGVRLSQEDQNILNRKLAYEAKQNGMIEGYGDQLWEVWRDSNNDPFEGYNDLGPAIEEAVKYAESLKDETQEAQDEAWAYVEALQQARHAAMFDEDPVEFAFMEQDSVDGLTKSFDKFVDNIEKVKDAFSAFKSKEAVGYQDFYNMMDFIGNSKAGFAKFSEMTGIAATDYEAFVNSVVANTDKWGKVDIGGVAAEMGISVDAAMSAMSESMTESLKDVAKQQIKYLSSLETMLEALAALESIGDISLGLGLEFTTTTGETVTIDTLNDIVKYWEILKQEDQVTLVTKLKTVLENGNSAADTALQKVFGKGFSLYDLLGGENFFTSENFDIGTIEAITSLSDLTQGQAYSLAMKMDAEIKLEEGSDFTINENGVRQYTESGYQKLQDYIKQNYKDFYKVEEYPFDFEVANKANVKLAEKGITIEGVDISGWSEMDKAMKASVKEKVEAAYAEEGLVIEVSPEGKLISTPILEEDAEPIDGGETPVKITPQWELADGSAGTLTQAITDAANAEGTTIAPEIPIDPKLFLKEGSTAVTTFINDLITLLKGEPFEPELNADGTVNPSNVLLVGAKAVITTLVSTIKGEDFNLNLDADGTVTETPALIASALNIITGLESKINSETVDVSVNADGTIANSEALIGILKTSLGDLTIPDVPVTVDGKSQKGKLTGSVSFEEADLEKDENGELKITGVKVLVDGNPEAGDLNGTITFTEADLQKDENGEIKISNVKVLVDGTPEANELNGTITFTEDDLQKNENGEIKISNVKVLVDGKPEAGELNGTITFTEDDLQKDENGQIKITDVEVFVDGKAELLNGEIKVTDFLKAVKDYITTQTITDTDVTVNPTAILGIVNGLTTFVENLKAQIPDSTDKEITINLKPVYSEDSLAGMSAQMFTDYLQSVVDSGDVIGQSYFEALAGKFSSLESEGIGLTQYGMGGFDTQEQYSTSRELIQQIKGELVVDDSQVQDAIKSATGNTKIEAEVVTTGEVEMPETEPVDGEVNYNKGEQEEPEDEEAAVNYTKGEQEEPSDEFANVNYNLGSVATPPDATALVHYKIGSVEKPAAISSGWTGSVNNITGSAFANGNVTALNAGAKLANKTLVGELGPELAVYNGQYHLLGQTGAEFVELPDDALIFNHLQTAGIISGQMKNARAQAFKGRADAAIAKATGSAMATGNVTGPAFASGIAGALAAVRRAKSVWQGLLSSLSAADLMGAGGGGGGGGGDNNLKAHIEDLQEWYNLSRQIAKIEQEINTLLAKRKNITDGHEYLKNLRETQKLLTEQVATQQVLVKYQQAQLEAQAQHINTHSIWSQFLTVGKDGLLQYKNGNETKGGKGSLSVLQQMNQMSGEKQVAFLAKLGYSYTDNDGNKLEGEELVAKFFEELQKQIDDYDALADTVAEAEEALEELESEIAAIEKEIRDNEIELGQNIYDIIVAAWEENIKNLKEQNDLIKEANEAYAEGIQEAIDAEREMYEQNKTISDREQLQRQLALLRRSGGSASEIADLESQLDDMLKDEYFANQEDALETIRDANERQVELMDQQVKLQEEALEYEKENGVIWTKVYEVMQGTDAEILNFMQGNDPSFFEKQTLEQENMLTEWAKKVGIYTEDRQRQNFIKELDNKSFTNSLVTADGKIDYTSIYNGLDDKDQKTLQSLFEMTYGNARLDGKNETEALKLAANALQEELKERKAQQTTESTKKNTNNSNNNNNNKNTQSNDNSSDVKYYSVTKYNINGKSATKGYNSNDKNSAIAKATSILASQGYTYSSANAAADARREKYKKSYATGGIIDYTGPAWVDGSKSKPERILSAEQNRILEEGLAMNAGRSDRLQEMFSNFAENLGASVRASISNIINRTSGSAITIQPGAVQLNIEQLNDKYDVDELFNDVADRLYSIASKASGRGVNRR